MSEKAREKTFSPGDKGKERMLPTYTGTVQELRHEIASLTTEGYNFDGACKLNDRYVNELRKEKLKCNFKIG